MQWERACHAVQRGSNGEEIWELVKSHASHHQLHYMLEAKLWAFALRSQFLNERLPKAQTVMKKSSVARRDAGVLLELIECFEEAYDSEIPIAVRLRNLGSCLERLSELPSIDLELLAWAAASRWLKRHNLDELAVICAEECSGLSLKLSDGALRDCFNLQLGGDQEIKKAG